MKEIWFDFDDTMVDWHGQILDVHARSDVFNRYVPYHEVTHHDYFKLYHAPQEPDWEWLRQKWREYHCAEKVTLLPHVADVFQQLKDEKIRVNIVTARGWHPDALVVTEQTMEHYGLSFHKVHSMHYAMSKGDIIKEHGVNPMAFVEDTIRHCDNVNAALPTLPIYLVNHPWNQQNVLYHRVNHLQDMLDHLLTSEHRLSLSY